LLATHETLRKTVLLRPSNKNDDVQLNVDVVNVLAKVTIPIPLSELIKIPSQMDKVKKFLITEETVEVPPVVLQAMNQDRKTGSHVPFFISLRVNNLFLHSCMLDLGASTNVMSLKVTNQSSLKTTRPYRNVLSMDSYGFKGN
jgi:hypothetical protein